MTLAKRRRCVFQFAAASSSLLLLLLLLLLALLRPLLSSELEPASGETPHIYHVGPLSIWLIEQAA